MLIVSSVFVAAQVKTTALVEVACYSVATQRLFVDMSFNDTPDVLQVVPISASADDRWRLTDSYVEEVWSEFLGPTATLMSRRLGRLIESRPGGAELEVGDFASSLGVAPSVAIRALDRLHRFAVVHSDLDRGLVGVSGYAPSVGDGRLFRLSEAGRVAHERLTAGISARERSMGRASRTLMGIPSAAGVEQLPSIPAG